MTYIVQNLVQQVKDTFPSFIQFPTAPNIRVKSAAQICYVKTET